MGMVMRKGADEGDNDNEWNLFYCVIDFFVFCV